MVIRMETGTYEAKPSEVFDAVLQIITRLGWTIESKNTETGKIIVSTEFSLRSWGERITIEVSRVRSQTNVLVTSTPEAQLIDWGKSRENERRVIRMLDDFIGRG